MLQKFKHKFKPKETNLRFRYYFLFAILLLFGLLFGRFFPPIPLLQELKAMQHLLLFHIDDLIEDVIKIFVIWRVYLWHQNSTTRFRNLILIIFFIPCFEIISDISDSLGHKFERIWCDWILTPFDIEHPESAKAKSSRTVGDIVEDITEDTIKFACLYTQFWFGNLIGANAYGTAIKSLRFFIMQEEFAQAAKLVAIIGTPADSYTRCDEFSNRIGAHAQSTILYFFGKRVLYPWTQYKS